MMADQWREYFYCDALTNDVLVAKGRKKAANNRNNKGGDNIISDGSIYRKGIGVAVPYRLFMIAFVLKKYTLWSLPAFPPNAKRFPIV